MTEQIHRFISETKSFISADSLSDFQDKLWENYEANNKEYEPEFMLKFDKKEFYDIVSRHYNTFE